MALIELGIMMLVIGIIYHVHFMLGLRRERQAMKAAGLIRGESRFPPCSRSPHYKFIHQLMRPAHG
jgi:putative membrane protein